MHRRCGSTHGYAHSEDLETGVRCSGATDHRADGATTRTLQPPLRLIPSFRRLHAFSAHSDRPEIWQECWAQVIRRAHSESERVIARIALNNTKTTLSGLQVSHSACGHLGVVQTTSPSRISLGTSPLPRRRTPDVARHVARSRSGRVQNGVRGPTAPSGGLQNGLGA